MSHFICAQNSGLTLDEGDYKLVTQNADFFIDSSNTLSIQDVQKIKFDRISEKVLNLEIVNHPVWLKLSITNNTKINQFVFEIENSNIDQATFFELKDGLVVNRYRIGDANRYGESDRFLDDPFPVFPTKLETQEIGTYYIKVVNKEPIIIPLYLGSETSMISKIQKRDLFFGVYTGIMVVMFLYNLFIFISLRTRIYFFYVVYIMLIYLAQSTFIGYSGRYLFFNLPGIADIGSFIFPAFVIVLGLVFISEFLNIKRYTPWVKYVFIVFASLCIISVALALAGHREISFFMLQPVAGISALFILIICIVHIRMGSRQAKFLLFAWSFFFIGVIVWVLKNLNVLEHGFLTHYSMPIGSALETVLLSFALADRINTLKKEREETQQQMLEEMRKNHQLTENINKELEIKVAERTRSLEVTNNDLNETLANLKSTQSQLIESEKLASLGQLTAGIAHEINNPINFVSSNVDPLRNDFKDVLDILNKYQHYARENDVPALKEILKEEETLDLEYSIQEISQLIEGIEEGAKRTSEIVTGLKNFSRTDEEELKESNINDGLRSTVAILKSQLRNINVDITYGEIPDIYCQLGKLNQVFMNIIDNSIDAVHDRWGESTNGLLTIKSDLVDEMIHIEISDNGNGIPEDVLSHIFDPFFTTKDVGEGTGLGLSISYGIIEKHNGTIEVKSEIGEGTTFKIKIPQKQG